MKTAKEILCEVFEAYGDDLQLNITLNPSVSLIEQAMEAYHEDKTRWISVEERLPEFGEPVFVWCRIYGRYIGTYQQIDGTRFGNWSDGKELGVLPPLFWQPLPTPPKINAE